MYVRYLLLFCFVFVCTGAFSKDERGHTSDMWRIFPFEQGDPKNKEIEKFYKMVHNYIDHPYIVDLDQKAEKRGANEAPSFIYENAEFKNMTLDNHRIWYHWGFNKKLENYEPLVLYIKNEIKNGGLLEEDEDKFWCCLKQHQSKRNKFLMDRWLKISGYGGISRVFNSQRKQANAFVTLLYCIHILGDHLQVQTDIIMDRKALYGEIYTAITNLAGKDESNLKKAKALREKLRLVQSDPKQFLDKLEKEFTPFLYSLKGGGKQYDYKAKFEGLGYKMKEI